MSANEKNVGNVVGLIKSPDAPSKTSVLWFKQTDSISNPDQGYLMVFNSTVSQWIPLSSLVNTGPTEFRFDKVICPNLFAQTEYLKDWIIAADIYPFTTDESGYILSWNQIYGVLEPLTWANIDGTVEGGFQKIEGTTGIAISGATVGMESGDLTKSAILGEDVWTMFWTINPNLPVSNPCVLFYIDASNLIFYDSAGMLSVTIGGSTETFNSFFTNRVRKTFAITWDPDTNYLNVYDTSGVVSASSGNINSGDLPDSKIYLFTTSAPQYPFSGFLDNYAFLSTELTAGEVGDIIDELEKAL